MIGIFAGSALYVFCIIAHTTLYPETNTDMVFVLDGQTMGSLTVVTSGSSYFEYNILVFANNSMPYGQHTFTLQTGRIGGARSLVLLDFIMYTWVYFFFLNFVMVVVGAIRLFNYGRERTIWMFFSNCWKRIICIISGQWSGLFGCPCRFRLSLPLLSRHS